MAELNFKHLRYFWTVARVGTIAEAGRVLNLAPHSISAQLATFEAALGVSLFRRVRRRLTLTDAGERILGMAEEIFALGDQIIEAVRDDALRRSLPLRIGFPDSMPKSVVHRLIEPALHVKRPGRLICREAPLAELLAELAVHRLDLVIADRPIPPDISVRGHSTLLGQSTLSVFAVPALAARLKKGFPATLNGAPFLLPGEDVAHRGALLQWFERERVQPSIVAELDDSALMKSFAQGGAGAVAAPTSVADHICHHYGLEVVGEIANVTSQVYAITTERRLSHPAMQAIHAQAGKMG